MLKGIAHDLLTPVSQLQLNLATLQTRLNSSEHDDLLSDIADSLRRVAGVASQVKSLKTSKGDEISDFVKEATHEVKALSESEFIVAKNISLEFESTHTSMMSPFSQTDISRILANLVHNAVDASTSGSVIQVSVTFDSNHGILTVKDSGKGIPKSAQSKVFDPEFTLKPGTGTGLGLAVVKYICDSKSAKINLSSELNRGTTVSIQFPVVRGAYV